MRALYTGRADILAAEYLEMKKNPRGGELGNESLLITKDDFVVLERMKEQVCVCFIFSLCVRLIVIDDFFVQQRSGNRALLVARAREFLVLHR